MSLAGKVNDFTRDDLLTFARTVGVNRHEALRVMGRVFSAVSKWRDFADEAGVDERKARQIERAHRRHLGRSRVRQGS